MIIQWPLLLLISVSLSCLTEVQGLKCYICDSKKNGCVVDVNLKSSEYLKDCAQNVLACVSFKVKTSYYDDRWAPDNQKEVWVQRECLYPRDAECFKWDKTRLPWEFEDPYWTFENVSFIDQVRCANGYRREDGLPLMEEPPASSLIRGRNPHPNYKVKSCKSDDGCNHWEEGPGTMFPHAKRFPIPKHNEKKAGGKINCYSCNSVDNPYCIVKQTSSDKKASHEEAYGCAMLSIYYIDGGLNKSSYFERDVWYPGDHWCLERNYEEIFTGYHRALSNSPVKHKIARTDEDEEPCGDEEYERALKERNTDNKYYWMGHRRFEYVEGFNAYLKCREQVKMKLGISGVGFHLKFDGRTADRIHNFYTNDGRRNLFAYVGFRFCGTQDLCNDWSDHQLYQEIKDEYSPTTTTDPTVTTTTEPPTTTSPKRGGGGGNGDGETGKGCVKKTNKNMAMKQVPSLPVGILLLALLYPMVIARLMF